MRTLRTALLALALATGPGVSHAGGFVFAEEQSNPDIITHPIGYDGTGGVISLSVCVDPTSANASKMEHSAQSVVATWNAQLATTSNLVSGGANEIPGGHLDFHSVLLHELGHCIGLSHANLATESGVAMSDQDHTKTTKGADASYDLGAGVDGVEGSSDDQRDDDVNLHWFEIGENNPFQMATTIDSTTYSRQLADLPGSHDYVANGDRDVAALLGVSGTEAVMQQGTFFDEAQRSLTHDDIATLRYAMSGLDEIAGNSDDYTISLSYAGLTTSCDMVIDFDNTETGFATCSLDGQFIPDPPPGPPVNTDHVELTVANVFFNTGWTWFFTSVCGDGVVAGGEACDDGGTAPGDGCDALCALESGWMCSGEPSTCSTTCGDGLIAGAEACDDGGTAPGDGCDAVCAIESGWTCAGEPSDCSVCGDGFIGGSESCDDGGTTPGDGCDAVCAVESGWTCAGEPSDCSVCGDGFIGGSETCDDGGTTPGDGCDAVCAIESGWTCAGEPSDCSVCGDGFIGGSETCDDGDTTPGDGCDAVCAVESGWMCSGEPSMCTAINVPAAGALGRATLALGIAALGTWLVRRRAAHA